MNTRVDLMSIRWNKTEISLERIVKMVKEVEELTGKMFCYLQVFSDCSGAIMTSSGHDLIRFDNINNLPFEFAEWKEKYEKVD